jgi:subtilisin family serine protease
MRRSLAAATCVVAALLPIASADAAPVKRTAATVTATGASKLTVGQQLRLTVTAKPAKGRRITRYRLSFGDKTKTLRGRRLTSKRVTHTYARAGAYTVKLTVTDNRRRTATAKLRINVSVLSSASSIAGPGPNPPASVTTPPAVSSAPAPLDLDAAGLELAPGSAVNVALPGPLASISRIDTTSGLGADISAQLTDAGLSIAARSGALPASVTVTVTGAGCTDTDCGRPLTMRVPVTVRELAAPETELTQFTSASPDRVAGATPLPGGGSTLQDELVITLGTPDDPGTRAQADAAADAAGGVVSGGIDQIGVFEVRWTGPQDLPQREAQLLAQPNVNSVSETQLGLIGAQAQPPGDWDDDGTVVTWPFTVTHAQQAWDQTTGSDVTVGIVDTNQVFGGHEDLNVIKKIGHDGAGWHATHVGGIACAKANGIGVVGFAWGCPIVTADWGDGTDKSVLQAMTAVAAAGAKVVNMSIGFITNGCASQAFKDTITSTAMSHRNEFRQFLRGAGGRDVIWTMSAGNDCTPGVASSWGINSDLGNVIAVAATNSDGQLASFSDYGDGVEVAAPGGVSVPPYGPADGSVGIWSTFLKSCFGGLFNCGAYSDTAPGGGLMVGTSMAAPVVAGIAALVRSKHPSYGASRAAGCITGSAGSGAVGSATTRSSLPGNAHPQVAYSGSIPIVNAEAAVDCNELQFDGSIGTDAPPATLGGYPMTAFGADARAIGDQVSSVPDPAGTILVNPDLEHLQVPTSWATWSHGFTGDVYFTGQVADPKIELTMPAGTKAFAFYAEPNTFASFTVEAIASDGTSSEPVDIQGNSGASYFGFYGIGGQTISSINVTASDPAGFAVGEFQISR